MARMRMAATALGHLLGEWTRDGEALPDALATALVELIDAYLVPAGTTLPAQRDIAQVLGVSRGTVSSAIGALESMGYVVSGPATGTRVRSGSDVPRLREGRMFSFTNAPTGVTDLATGALPASRVAVESLKSGLVSLTDYLETDGYFPAGVPLLRQAVADKLTRDGVPTLAAEILITSGAQHATLLAMQEVLAAGDTALAEDPTSRGGLALLRRLGVRVEAVPWTGGGLDPGRLQQGLQHKPAALYCQTGIHNPTGQAMADDARRHLADVVNERGLVTIEDACSADLTLSGEPAPTLRGLVDPSLLVTVGSMSKLFWGGLRIGWLRAEEERIMAILKRREINEVASSALGQLYAVRMLQRAEEARAERRDLLTAHGASARTVIGELFEDWVWEPGPGSAGVWVDVRTDAMALAVRAERAGVRLAAGPMFSPTGGSRSMVRLPLGHDADVLRHGLEIVRSVLPDR